MVKVAEARSALRLTAATARQVPADDCRLRGLLGVPRRQQHGCAFRSDSGTSGWLRATESKVRA